MPTSKPQLLTRLRRMRRRVYVLATALAYLTTAAFLPAGHMAAPLASGTPFHLCPGDSRNALLLSAFESAASAESAAHSLSHQASNSHRRHRHLIQDHAAPESMPAGDVSPAHSLEHGQRGGAATLSGDERVLDSGCSLAGFADVDYLAATEPYGAIEPPADAAPLPSLPRPYGASRLRPSARSPPTDPG